MSAMGWGFLVLSIFAVGFWVGHSWGSIRAWLGKKLSQGVKNATKKIR